MTIKTNYHNGVSDSFKIDTENELKTLKIKSLDSLAYDKLYNQVGQLVTLFENDNEQGQIIAEVNGKFFYTGFYDYNDLKENSDYLPILYNGKIYCYYSYYYASLEYYYPKK